MRYRRKEKEKKVENKERRRASGDTDGNSKKSKRVERVDVNVYIGVRRTNFICYCMQEKKQRAADLNKRHHWSKQHQGSKGVNKYKENK